MERHVSFTSVLYVLLAALVLVYPFVGRRAAPAFPPAPPAAAAAPRVPIAGEGAHVADTLLASAADDHVAVAASFARERLRR